jgi:hypothetical protein
VYIIIGYSSTGFSGLVRSFDVENSHYHCPDKLLAVAVVVASRSVLLCLSLRVFCRKEEPLHDISKVIYQTKVATTPTSWIRVSMVEGTMSQ